MKTWEKFELECVEYLKSKYSGKGVDFVVTGGHDSNKNDVQVIKDNNEIMSIECKMSVAQCGQFVLFIDEKNKKFIFSERNKTPYDNFVRNVIDEMEHNFEECCISSKDLPISEGVISRWVKNYYMNVKKSLYCITKSDLEFIIFPMQNIDNYFTFCAKYRMKKSGSTLPTSKNKQEIEKLLKQININTSVELNDSECYVELTTDENKFTLNGSKYQYLFIKEGSKYRIRRLSNTYNANFIVSIKLKETKQKNADLLKFEEDLIK